MPLASRHPYYEEHEQDWEECRDCYEGEAAIKEKASRYLPPTGGMCLDGYPTPNTKGAADYTNYKSRAQFHNYFKKSVLHHMGLLWHKAATVELPKKMEPLKDDCTRHHESVLQLLRVMHEELLVTGRLLLYIDLPKGQTLEEVLPTICLYRAEAIINWDEGRATEVDADTINMVVLDESGPRRKDLFSWERIDEFRVLFLGDPQLNENNAALLSDVTGPVFSAGIFEGEDDFDPKTLIVPNWRGKTLDFIPVVFINSKDTTPTPDDPPQLDLARLDLHIYKSEADLRQALHMQAQPTLVLIGDGNTEQVTPEGETEQKGVRTGAGAVIRISNPAGDAKYIGVDPTGIPEMRTTLENDMRRAEMMSGSMTDNRSNDKESGDAMGKRMAAESCKLINVAETAALGLQKALRMIAEWMGLDPEEVTVTANTEFSYTPLTPKDLLDLQSFKTAGGPISDESIHINVKRSGLSDKDYEAENEAIAEEEPRIDHGGAPLDAPLDPMQQQTLDHAEERLALDKQAAQREAKAPAR